MDPRQFRALLSRAIVTPIILALLLSVLLLFLVFSQTNAMQWVNHTDAVIGDTSDLLRHVIDMETGVRAYVATGDGVFLEPYTAAQQNIPNEIDGLARSVADNSAQSARFQQIRQSISDWQQYAARIIALRHQGAEPAQAVPVNLEGKRMMDELRQQIATFVRAEESLRTERVARARRLTSAAFIGIFAFTLVAGVVLSMATRSTILNLSGEFQTAIGQANAEASALQASEQRWITTLSSIGDAVIVTDPDGRLTFINPVAEELTGYKQEEARGRELSQIFNIVNESTRVRHEDPVSKIKRLRSVVGLANHTVLIKKDGTELPIDDSGAPIFNDGGEMIGMVLVFRDISERRQAERALRAADRLAATGKLAASIAHEIHNPLANIGGLIYLLRKQEISGDAASYAQQVAEELRRLTSITHQMLALNRESVKPVPVDLREIVDETLLSSEARLLRHNIEVRRNYDGLPEVTGFPGELRQVFSNLVGNAIDAMDSGGVLSVTIGTPAGTPDAAEVRVRDTGHGIPPGAQPRIFQSFFTTKGEKGTGLGLWIVQNIVNRHDGQVDFVSSDSGENRGTEFRVLLPRSSK